MNQIAGSRGAAPLWHDIMILAHRDTPVRDFAVPKGVEQRSGEWFIKGASSTYSADETPLIKITKPFDGDEFKLSSFIQKNAGDMHFTAEAANTIHAIEWRVNEKIIGTGADVWWQPTRGTFTITATGKTKKSTDIAKDIITITIH
jgi:membrane carboxypeptidase/penicillin-binding protein PbpC